MTTNDQQAVREADTICPAPVTLTFDLLTLKVVSESRVYVGLLGPLCSRLKPDVRDGQMSDVRQTSDRETDRRQTRIIA